MDSTNLTNYYFSRLMVLFVFIFKYSNYKITFLRNLDKLILGKNVLRKYIENSSGAEKLKTNILFFLFKNDYEKFIFFYPESLT